MVYQDVGDSNSALNSELRNLKLEKKFLENRMLSVFLDALILFPVVFALLHVGNRFFNFSQMVQPFLFLLIYSFLQSVFLVWKQATPGQQLLKLHMAVVKPDKKSSFKRDLFAKLSPAWSYLFSELFNGFRFFGRQLLFNGSSVFMLMPQLSFFSHPTKKAFYDRWLKTEVKFGLPYQDHSWTYLYSKELVQSVNRLQRVQLLILCTFGYLLYTAGVSPELRQNQKLVGLSCEQVSDDVKLTAYVELYLKQKIDSRCLSYQAVFGGMKSGYWVNIAKGLVERSAHAQNYYFNKACAEHKDTKFCLKLQDRQLQLSKQDSESKQRQIASASSLSKIEAMNKDIQDDIDRGVK